MTAGDRVRASVRVPAPTDVAFRLFTDEIDQWWRRGPRFRASGAHAGVLVLEGRAGGALLESFERDGHTTVVQTGTVLAWEPPHRLLLSWRATNFADDEATTVEVTFAPGASGTLVTVTHTGWAALRPDHPVRHGAETAAFIGRMGRWWGDLLTALRVHALGQR